MLYHSFRAASSLYNQENHHHHFSEILPLKGMMMIENVLEDLREAKPELAITGIFITRFDARKNINKAVEEVRKQYANVIFNNPLAELI